MKIGKILLWILYAGFAAALVTGGVIRTQSRLEVVSAEHEYRSDRQGGGIGAGGEGQGQNQGQSSGDRQGGGIGAGGEGQGQNQGDGQGSGRGDGGQGQSSGDGGGQGQNQGSGGQGGGNGQGGDGQGSGGQGQGNGGQNDDNYQYRDEDEILTADDWLTESGEAVEVSSDLLLVDTGSDDDLLIEGRAWRYALEEGFSVQVGDALDVSGYWEDGEFKPGVIENQSTGETVTLRDPDGRPMWSGNR
ncbi:MAG: hypothetical protein JXJ17_18405 [Anaerolineae bacterium]|nr:hypothetical protein [Anaerolineae bacterium]